MEDADNKSEDEAEWEDSPVSASLWKEAVSPGSWNKQIMLQLLWSPQSSKMQEWKADVDWVCETKITCK